MLVVWKDKKAIVIESDECKWIHSIRRKNEKVIEILTDPWSEYSAIWELNIENLMLKKVRNFDEYRKELYQEIIKW